MMAKGIESKETGLVSLGVMIGRMPAPQSLLLGFRRSIVFTLVALILATPAYAGSKSYPDGQGGEVSFPEGDASFADEVVHYDPGSKAPVERARNPQESLGVPDFNIDDRTRYLSLGCGGELVVKFTDNILINVPGPDLYVFEIGPAVEPTALAISGDGENWTRIGRIEGGKAEVDIAPYVDAGEEFRFVRLVDMQADCGGETPGADIDAVGAIGSATRIALDSSVLFETGKFELAPAASKAISEAVADTIPGDLHSVVVAGHTDNVGNAEYNLQLSQNRAEAVADFLINQAGFDASRLSTEAWGLMRPIASNDTTEGRAQNRRVEITLRRSSNLPDGQPASIEILGLWRAKTIGIVEISHENGAYSGRYTSDNGRIEGAFTSDTVFDGYWIEDESRERCTSEKAGSFHWGRLRLEFDSEERDRYIAQWSYCEEQQWRGNWPSGDRLL